MPQLSPKELLQWIRLGIINKNYDAVIKLIDDALEQFPSQLFEEVKKDNDAKRK